MTLRPGDTLGPYRILERLGAGGLGEVFRARDTRLARDVAIKVLGDKVIETPEGLRRFTVEAKAASALNHPNILTVHEIGEADSGPYIVTEFVDGDTVRALLGRGPLPLDRALAVALDACRGLAKAHEAGIVHRDIKPENLMVTRDGHAKILDFGLAKFSAPDPPTLATTLEPALTATGALIGTPGYLTPEQLEGKPADARSDLYALGLVIYEMIAGRNPLARPSLAETVKAILHDRPPPLDTVNPDVPVELSGLIERCLERDPVRRPAGARELIETLERVCDLRTVSKVGSPPPGRKSGARWIAVSAVAAAAIVIALIASNRSPGPARSPAESRPLPDPAFALAEGRRVVAVLPVDDASGDPDLARANVGAILADALVQILADRREFYVASPVRLETAAQTLGRPLDAAGDDPAYARRIGHEVAADLVLTGILSRVGETYSLSATLTDLGSETVFGSFRAESRDRDRLLSDLTAGIAAGIERRFEAPPGAPARDIGAVATRSVEAYAHFVRGTMFGYAGLWESAIPELTKAVDIDPGMGIAWTELACAYSFAGDEARSLAAQREAERMLDRVNHKERVWIEMNGIWVNSGNGEEYMKAARAFVESYPDDREGYFYAGLGAEHLLGDCAQAISWYERAYRLTPIYYPITKGLVDCHLKLGRRDRAIEALERYLSLGAAGEHGRAQAAVRLESLRS